ncbi:MAG TPA: 2-oxoglutarate dehydrogenase complex dihydrolipoyllysine-residue succinyltransferase [Xanthomonadaceae bacterium]|nr:2-oxoglutarate dehydrogenase complex dihydrolipoyllysine-residue succinyltransferase [Xanthomonadaceae bacterium]
MSTEVKVPVLPESVSDATIAGWHKKAGDAVKRDENLVDLETDKVVLEVPSPVDGVLKEIRAESGATVNSQQVIAIIEAGAAAVDEGKGEKPTAKDAKEDKKDEKKSAPEKAGKDRELKSAKQPEKKESGKGAELSPAGRRVAGEHDIDASQVEGSGRGGRVTKEDLVNYMRAGGEAGARAQERVRMTRIRQRIAERMMEAKNSIAMLTSFNEVDLSRVKAMRRELGEQFEKSHGVRLGFMSFFVKAAANALMRRPVVNASVDGDEILYHGYADISIAVATEKGLVTPVLRNADRMGFDEIEAAIADYAKAAREGSLKLEDLQGGTFTVTNGGTFGSLMSTPIVNPPQSAILGMHAIKDRPVAVEGQVVVAPMMYIALSYDHRIVDGKDAVLFLVDIKEQLEDPHRMLLGL